MSAATRTEPASRRRRTARAIEGQEIALVLVLFALWALLALGTDNFLSAQVLRDLLFNVAPIALIGVGMSAVIVTAGIDVSVGSGVALVMVVVAKLLRDFDVSAPLAVLAAIGLGLVLGAVNGGIVALGGIHPIIVTFATLNIYRFAALEVFDSKQVSGVPNTLAFLGGGAAGRPLGLPTAWLLAALFAAGLWIYMRHWPTGRHLYAIGHDVLSARLAGVRVRRRQLFAYLVTGALVGVAACVLIGSGGLVEQNAGVGLELQVIAAVVIGGTSIVGGRGTVLGTMLGALLVATVNTAVTLLSWPSELTTFFVGLFILIAVGVDLVRSRRRGEQARP